MLLVVAGLGFLLLGARWFVGSAVELASHIGISEAIIGLTIVAAGTSLPEVATSVIAALRGQRDIAVGNVVGSNLFNLMGVLGVCGTIAPNGLPVSAPARSFDIPVMLAVSAACLPIFATGHRINRWEGLLFLGYYVAYSTWLVLSTTDHSALSGYSHVMTTFVLPLTVVTLVVMLGRSWHKHLETRRRNAQPT